MPLERRIEVGEGREELIMITNPCRLIATRRTALGWAAATIGNIIASSAISPLVFAKEILSNDFRVILPKDFRVRMTRARVFLNTNLLHDFEPAPVIANHHLEYHAAFKHRDGSVEIRYAITDMKWLEEDIEKAKKSPQPGQTILPLSDAVQSFSQTTIANIADQRVDGPSVRPPTPFKPSSVRSEFGADFGFACRFRPRSTFSSSLDGNAIVLLYRAKEDGTATSEFAEIYERTFYALRFI
jgi:hypothetical protein